MNPPPSARALRGGLATVLSFAALTSVRTAHALDKQGSAHGGDVGGAESGFNVSGSGMLGVSLFNPSYAARPNNTGLALFRYAAHADFDLIGRNLSIPLDLNMFTDRERKGVAIFAPSEFDIIIGLTTTQTMTKATDLELGARVENDRPVTGPGGGYTQTYADIRARALYSLARQWDSLRRSLADGDLSGYFTLGWFAINPSYAARPDNTGLALFRYTEHAELSVWHRHLALGLDATFFTDKKSDTPLRPSELDFTAEVIGRYQPFEAHLAYERDMPIDQGGLVQQMLFLVFAYNFDLGLNAAAPMTKPTALEPAPAPTPTIEPAPQPTPTIRTAPSPAPPDAPNPDPEATPARSP
jgi:hypothetical protein